MKLLLLLAVLPCIFGSEVIWKNNGPTEFLVGVFKITELKDVHNLAAAATQSESKWIRPNFMKSWHAFSLLDSQKKATLIDLIKESDLVKEKPPKKKYYDVALVFGYFQDRLKRRLDYLIELHKRGIKFGKIYLLGMTRPIKTGSGFDKEINLPNNSNKELSSIEILWSQVEKSEELQQIPVVVLKTQKKVEGYGAASEKLLIQMAGSGDVNGKTFLLVSDGCYGCSQGALVETILQKCGVEVETVWDEVPQTVWDAVPQKCGVEVETVCDAVHVKYSVEGVLDCIAKCLHYLYRGGQ